jgi:hypothetical protein
LYDKEFYFLDSVLLAKVGEVLFLHLGTASACGSLYSITLTNSPAKTWINLKSVY